MPRRLTAVALVALAGVALAQQKQTFGPEWTKDNDAGNFWKNVPIRVTTHEGGNVQAYTVNLRHGTDTVTAFDTDGGHTASATLRTATVNVTVEARKDAKGNPHVTTVQSGKCLHFDLNGDGAFDAWIDRREAEEKFYIAVGTGWLRVHDTRGSFRGGEFRRVESLELKAEFVWDGKVWNNVGPRR